MWKIYKDKFIIFDMGKVESLKNLWKYHTNTFLPQVDPDVMGPIFEESLGKMPFYSKKEDTLTFEKTSLYSLDFYYFSENRRLWIDGTIYAQKPRKDFDGVDLLSYMNIIKIEPDVDNKIIDVIADIVQSANIEKVCTLRAIDFDKKIAKLLADIEGRRDYAQYDCLTDRHVTLCELF